MVFLLTKILMFECLCPSKIDAIRGLCVLHRLLALYIYLNDFIL